MKSHIILGSIAGFLVAGGFSLADGCSGSVAVGRACIAALLVAPLARWWSLVWLQSLGDAIQQRRHASMNPPVKTKPVTKT